MLIGLFWRFSIIFYIDDMSVNKDSFISSQSHFDMSKKVAAFCRTLRLWRKYLKFLFCFVFYHYVGPFGWGCGVPVSFSLGTTHSCHFPLLLHSLSLTNNREESSSGHHDQGPQTHLCVRWCAREAWLWVKTVPDGCTLPGGQQPPRSMRPCWQSRSTLSWRCNTPGGDLELPYDKSHSSTSFWILMNRESNTLSLE